MFKERTIFDKETFEATASYYFDGFIASGHCWTLSVVVRFKRSFFDMYMVWLICNSLTSQGTLCNEPLSKNLSFEIASALCVYVSVSFCPACNNNGKSSFGFHWLPLKSFGWSIHEVLTQVWLPSPEYILLTLRNLQRGGSSYNRICWPPPPTVIPRDRSYHVRLLLKGNQHKSP